MRRLVLCGLTLAALAGTAAADELPPPYLASFGTRGVGNGQFYSPWAIEIDGSGHVFVSDRINENVQEFTAAGVYVAQFGSSGWHAGEFNSPIGIASGNGQIYVADLNNSRIERFAAGTYLGEWGSSGSGDGQFVNPYDVAVGPDGSVWVADSNNLRVQRFTATGAYSGQFAAGGGPRGIAVDEAGNVYAAEVITNQVRKFSPDGTVLLTIGGPGSGNGQFNRPYGLALNRAGEIYVCDKDNDRIQKFSAAGTFLTKWGSYGTGPGQFDQPTQVAVDPTTWHVYVVDSKNNRVQIFGDEPVGVKANRATWGKVKALFEGP